MDLLVSIYLSSIAGAALFFFGGRLSARASLKAPVPAPALESEDQKPTKADIAEAVRALEIERRGRESLGTELLREREERGRVEAEARAALERYQKELARRDEEARVPKAALTQGPSGVDPAEVAREAARATAAEKRAVAAEARAAAAEARVKATEEQKRALSEQVVSAEEAKRALSSRVTGTETRATVAEQRAKAAEERAAQATAQAAELRTRLSEVTAAKVQLEESLASARLAVQEAAEEEAALSAAQEAALSAAQNKEGEVGRLKLENEHLRRAVDALEKEKLSNPDRAELQRRSMELTMKSRVIEQRTLEFERKDAENEELRGKVEALSAVAREAELLRTQVRDLSARSFAEAIHTKGARPAKPAPSRDAALLERDLNHALESLIGPNSTRQAAVLSDVRGLLVAGAGDSTYFLELAAAASFTTVTGERLRHLLPLGEPVRLTLVDANDVVFSTHWLRSEGEDLLVSTLIPGDGKSDPRIEEFSSRLVDLIGWT